MAWFLLERFQVWIWNLSSLSCSCERMSQLHAKTKSQTAAGGPSGYLGGSGRPKAGDKHRSLNSRLMGGEQGEGRKWGVKNGRRQMEGNSGVESREETHLIYRMWRLYYRRCNSGIMTNNTAPRLRIPLQFRGSLTGSYDQLCLRDSGLLIFSCCEDINPFTQFIFEK